MNRYARQISYKNLGPEGQKKLLSSKAAIVGMGALGSVSASELARAGVGFLRIIDRDLVELSNLQRQTLYTEEDVKQEIPKVYAAEKHLKEGNSEIFIEPVFSDLNSENADALLRDVDLVIDATDNIETRYLINEYCVEHKIPWIYGGAVATEGMTANFLPGEACFSCFFGAPDDLHKSSSGRTCSTVGVLNMTTAMIASLQAVEAVKILTGSPDVRKDVLFLEIWENERESIPLEKDPDCPVCAKHQYHYLGKPSGTHAISVCGKDSFQVVPAGESRLNLEEFAQRLSGLGSVTKNPFFLTFESQEASFKLFPDGRAVINRVNSEGQAKSVYAEYIGI